MASVYKKVLKDGKTVRWCAMFRDATGKQHKRTFRLRKDADEFLTRTGGEVLDGTWRRVRPLAMAAVFDLWLVYLETRINLGEIKPSSSAGYKCGIRQLSARFGGIRSDQLSPAVVERWRSEAAKRIAGGEMAPKTFTNGFNLLSSVLKWARKPAQSFLRHDPLDGVDRVKPTREDRQKSARAFLQPEEIGALLAAAETTEESAVVHLALFCGLRRGEVFALKWIDIEAREGESGGRVHVRRGLSAGRVTGPKTENALRVVDAAPDVLEALERHREAVGGEGEDFLFRSKAGTPHDLDNWTRRVWRPLRERAGIRATIGLHSLRHTFGSLLIDQGEHVRYVADQLGHSSPAFTLSVYAHSFDAASTRAMDRLQGAITTAKRARFAVLPGGKGNAG